MDTATYAKHPDDSLCHVHRVKDIVIPDGRWVFPVKEGILRNHNPEAHDTVKHDTSRPLGDVPAETLTLYPPDWDDPSAHGTQADEFPIHEAAEPASPATPDDCWELRGIRSYDIFTNLVPPFSDLPTT